MEFLNKFRNWKEIEEHAAGSVIYPEGNPAEFLYVIVSGEVELSLGGELLEVEKLGGIIGEMALFDSAERSATAKALTDVKLARLDRDQLTAMMKENIEFSLQIMAVLANRLRAVNKYFSMRLGSA
ncbi:MAG: cyclic nucleotide-binding domain-containing protein [Lysobacterales bacterium]